MRRRISSIYICLFVERVTEVTVNEQEDTSKKLTTKFCIFAEECHTDVVHSFLWFDDLMDEIVIKSSRKTISERRWDFQNDKLQQNYVSSVVDDSWRSWVFEISQIDPISTLDCSDCSRKRVLTIHSSVMYVNTIPSWMDIQTDIKRW